MPSVRVPWSPRDTLKGMLLALAACALLWVSGRGLVAELTRLPPNRFFETHEERLGAEEDEGRSLAKAIDLYADMPAWTQGSQELGRLGMLRVLEHKRPHAKDAAPIESSRPPLMASLRRETVAPLTLAYLAESALLEEHDPAEAFRYLKQSYRVAPIEPDFFFYRLGIALQCIPEWDYPFLRSLRREMLGLFPESGWSPNRRRFIELVKKHSRILPFVRRMLQTDQETYQRFEQALAKGR